MTSKNPRSVGNRSWGAERIYYISNYLYQGGKIYRCFSLIFKRLNQLLFHVNIPPQVIIGKGLDLPHGGFGIVIHHDTVIGNEAIIFHNVTIGNGGARIGDRVYLGTGSVIIGAVKVGNDVTIGANTVVTFDVPDNMTVVGQKSRIIDSGKSIAKKRVSTF